MFDKYQYKSNTNHPHTKHQIQSKHSQFPKADSNQTQSKCYNPEFNNQLQ